MLTVSEIMTREPYTLGPDSNLSEARQLMAEHHIRHVPVVSNDGSLIGVISQRDILAAADSNILTGESAIAAADRYVALSTVMKAPVQTVDERDSLRSTALHMQKNKMGCLPVLRDGSLIGIITDSDFVDIAINLMEQLEAQEPQESEFDDPG